jgi:PDGLE domain
MRSRRNLGFLIAGLVVAVLLAGVVSHYASSAPDGLERVAAQQGLDANEADHQLADGPLAGYQVAGIDDGPVAGGLAGAAGVAVTFLLASGIALAVRRRSSGDIAVDETR